MRLAVCAVAILLTVLPACGQVASTAQPPVFLHDRFDAESLVGKPAPKLTLRSTGGDKLSLESLRGQPVLITFWATWCGTCAVDLRNITNLSLPPGVISLAVDFDRDPAAAVAYLTKTNNSIRNFHDDGSVRSAFHLRFEPFTESVLIDSHGRIIFSARSIFRDELKVALSSLGLAPSKPESYAVNAVQHSTTSVADIRSAAREAVENQSTYVEKQEKYLCRYQVVTRDHYDSGASVHATQHIDEVFATNGRPLESRLVEAGTDKQSDLRPDAASSTFSVWLDPVLSAVLDHSILSNILSYKITNREDGQQREYVNFTFRGDPDYNPSTDTERIAQSLEGSIVLDITNKIFLIIAGESAYDVIDAKRFLLQQGIPTLDFHAAPFQGVNLPSVWSVPAYRAVSAGPKEKSQWNSTLIRTFGERESCQIYHVTTKILPGFEPVPAQK